MPFPRNLLHDREELVLDLRPHWVSLLVPGLAALGGIIVGAVLLVLGSGSSVESVTRILAAVAILAGVAYFVWKYLVWNTTMFVLTTDRIVSRRGVLSKSGIEIPLERINTVFFEQRLIERMLGSGDLAIESAGERGTETFNDIRKPSIVQKEIYVQMEANENRKFDRMRPVDQAPAAPDIAGQIEKLAELHQKGMLSDSEFAAKKAELLDRM